MDTPRLHSPSLREYCQDVLEISRDVFKAPPAPPLNIDIAETKFQIHVNNSELASALYPSLKHLQTDSTDAKPQVRVYVWAQVSTGNKLPSLPSTTADVTNSTINNPHDGETLFFNEDEWVMAYQAPRQHLSIANIRTNEAVFCVPDVRNIFPVDGRPFRAIFQWFLNVSQHQIVHAAGVGFPEGGVIITGKSGAGKSTTSVACLNSELKFAGDENVVISTSGTPKVYSLYNTANLDDRSISLLPFMNKKNISAQYIQTDKLLYNLYENFPEKTIVEFPLKGIIVSKVAGTGPNVIEPLSPATALTALAPTSLFQIPGNKSDGFLRMSNLVKRVPCFQLTLGASIEELPSMMAKFVRKISQG